MFDQNDPFAGATKTPSVTFKDLPVGSSQSGTVIEAPKMVQSTNFDTGEPDFWDAARTQPKMSVVTRLKMDDGEERSLWAQKPSAMFRAIGNAQQEAGKLLSVGDRITVTFTEEKPNPEKPRLAPQKMYQVAITPGDAFAAGQPAQAAPPPGLAAFMQTLGSQPAPAAPPAAVPPPGVDAATWAAFQASQANAS